MSVGMLRNKRMMSMRLDLPDALGPIKTLSGPNVNRGFETKPLTSFPKGRGSPAKVSIGPKDRRSYGVISKIWPRNLPLLDGLLE